MNPTRVRVFRRTAPAKINLGLFIKGRRPDGYHDLETLFVAAPALSDELKLRVLPPGAAENELIVSGLGVPGAPQENLCLKAWALLKAAFPEKVGCVRLELRKEIPAGAGLGGGSSDAAAMLRLLNEAFALGLSAENSRLSP